MPKFGCQIAQNSSATSFDTFSNIWDFHFVAMVNVDDWFFVGRESLANHVAEQVDPIFWKCFTLL